MDTLKPSLSQNNTDINQRQRCHDITNIGQRASRKVRHRNAQNQEDQGCQETNEGSWQTVFPIKLGRFSFTRLAIRRHEVDT